MHQAGSQVSLQITDDSFSTIPSYKYKVNGFHSKGSSYGESTNRHVSFHYKTVQLIQMIFSLSRIVTLV